MFYFMCESAVVVVIFSNEIQNVTVERCPCVLWPFARPRVQYLLWKVKPRT